LTAEQCQAIQAHVREQQAYFDRLLARINETGFPPQDRLRREVLELRDRLKDLAMHLHYLQCTQQTGGDGRRRG